MNYKKNILENFEDFKKQLKTIVDIESTDQPKDGNHPFGKNITLALEKTLEIFQANGFEITKSNDNLYGYAEIGPKDGELVGVLCHLDVVPAGDLSKWKTNPFELTEKDNKLYGRGSQDDKGPTLAVMHGLKAFLDSGQKLTKRIRFIFGTNEESGQWKAIKAYSQNEKIPSFSIVPDAWFPSILSEKHIKRFKLTITNDTDIKDFKLGSTANVVPGIAKWKYSANLENALKDLNYKYDIENDYLNVYGNQGHAMLADTLENAIAKLANALSKTEDCPKIFKLISENIGLTGTGGIFGNHVSKNTGIQTMNIGVLEFKQDRIELLLDTRIPFEINSNEVEEKTRKLVYEKGFETFEVIASMDGYYHSLDTDLMKNAIKAYQEITDDKRTMPGIVGGGTYARALPNAIVFGFAFPTDEPVAHVENEYIDLENTKKIIEIYAKWFELIN